MDRAVGHHAVPERAVEVDAEHLGPPQAREALQQFQVRLHQALAEDAVMEQLAAPQPAPDRVA